MNEAIVSAICHMNEGVIPPNYDVAVKFVELCRDRGIVIPRVLASFLFEVFGIDVESDFYDFFDQDVPGNRQRDMCRVPVSSKQGAKMERFHKIAMVKRASTKARRYDSDTKYK